MEERSATQIFWHSMILALLPECPTAPVVWLDEWLVPFHAGLFPTWFCAAPLPLPGLCWQEHEEERRTRDEK